MKLSQHIAISVVSVAVFFLLWQTAATRQWVDPLLLPSLTDIGLTARELLEDGYRQVPLWQHIAVSLARALSAFALAIAIGIPLGLLMGLSDTLAAILNPFVQFLRPLPKIALIPLAVVWLGIGESSKFFLIFIATFLSVVVGASAAVERIGRSRIRVAQTLGATRRQIFMRVVLPDALPDLFTTVRLSIGIGWTSLIAAEMVAASSGLGWMVVNASAYLRTDIVMLGILLLGGIGYLLDLLILGLQRVVVPWAGKE
ncbi:ABC transporter permease [Pseudocitrobacter corydidari]|uniref:Aliphatic sulfonates transport permease protein SsuC n=1 Tax=Pseudocitrobacter corydidari TaxID=2891570 RepID=A0ABY3S2W1_9ENTR|nr:ABC transporter permease [Pseudocitrobacter corydidari]AGB78727.1 ABC-type nitrate/sulfonate/bicarbonate transport system, permease component [Enterobacteriaceae bacterium strain FGI 57]UGS41041.1 Putative aliphatic sulfonates transport permease protein SsuC [Pseudocitrobacter corydidari]